MSRGGFGGGPRGGLKGATWDQKDDAKFELDVAPTPDYPKHPNLKRPLPFTDSEKRQFKYYKSLQTDIHRGPLYTQSTKRDANNPKKTFNEEQFNQQYGTNRKADMDPFTGVETYSMRYLPKKNAIPRLSGIPFNKDLFPKELWSTLEGEDGEEVRRQLNGAIHKKSLMMGGTKDATAKSRAMENLKLMGEGDEEEDADEEVPEEDQDSNFEDDEEDMGGDYDAEQYFDNGDADDGDGDGGGGGDDY